MTNGMRTNRKTGRGLISSIIKCVLFFVIFNHGFISYSQETRETNLQDKDFKNSVFGSMGFIFVAATASVYYERDFLFTNIERMSFFGRGGITVLTGDGSTDLLYSPGIGFGFLTGRKLNHFEMATGISVTIDNASFNPFPLLNLGYRWQSSSKRIMFRAGAGLPELIYIGAGFRF